MAEEIPTSWTDKVGRIFYPDGKPAHGPEERAEAGRLQNAESVKRSKKVRAEHSRRRSPVGLAEIRTSSGLVVRKSGTPLLN